MSAKKRNGGQLTGADRSYRRNFLSASVANRTISATLLKRGNSFQKVEYLTALVDKIREIERFFTVQRTAFYGFVLGVLMALAGLYNWFSTTEESSQVSPPSTNETMPAPVKTKQADPPPVTIDTSGHGTVILHQSEVGGDIKTTGGGD